MLVDLGHAVYVDEFETPFLEASAEFFKARHRRRGSKGLRGRGSWLFLGDS